MLKLTTEHLVLRTPRIEDVEILCAYANRNKSHLNPWEPARNEEYYGIAHWEQEIGTCLTQMATDQRLQLYLFNPKSPDMLLGQCNFSSIIRGPFQACLLGYALDKDTVGKGLMYEALQAAIRYVFTELNLHRVMANHIPTNERSSALLERLGFEREGYAKEYLQIAGIWQDHVLTALTNKSWREIA